MIPCPYCGLKSETRAGITRHVKYCQRGPHARSPQSELLDCMYCDSKGWKDFRELSLHVANDHLYVNGITPSKEVERAVYSHVKEMFTMSVPQPKIGANGALTPFLKRIHIKGDKATLMFLGAREPGPGGYSDLFVDVKLGREQYTWGLKADSPNYSMLFKRFGSNEKNWKGPVKVVIAKDKFINVVAS